MLINFNIEKLDRLLFDFYKITGMTISVWNAEYQQLSYQPKGMQNFCRTIKSTPEGNHRCFLSDKELCLECINTGKPATHYCHAGLVDTAVPIKFKDKVLGFMMFGQIADRQEIAIEPILKKLSHDLKIDYNNLFSLYDELEAYDQEKIDSAANILKMATRYLWLSEYIEIGYNTTASQLDDYIRTNLKNDLSVNTLCTVLGISKNKLYEISHEWFEASIGEYISKARIEEAKRLISTTDLPISEISVAVGIKDYNYFTKFFKFHVGTPPLKYRKSFRH